MLVENILPFWLERMVDRNAGGFYGRINGRNELIRDAPKGIILNSRILWTFSAVFSHFGSEQYRETATRAFDYLKKYFLDREFGGVYWMLNPDGSPAETKKQVYAQAFGIYALSEFYQATGNQDSLELALSIYSLVEQHSYDARNNGYLEAFDRQWNLLEDLRLSEKDANEAKTMNTHLHILEAYTGLYQVWPDASLGRQLDNLIRLFLRQFISTDNGFHLFFDVQWNLKSSTQSYGHDIEGAWLLLRAAEVLGDRELIRECQETALMLTDAALRGLDIDGGLMYEGNASRVTNSEKHWWPQAEALVGLLNAYQISSRVKYLEMAEKNWDFIQRYLVDPKGEWHWKVNKDGYQDYKEDKAGPWKAPYHNGRAMLELMERLG